MRTGPAQARSAPGIDLRSLPITVGGDWGQSSPVSALTVIARMREVALVGVRLLSDRQPAALRVDNHTSGPPSIWLHDAPADLAWIIVDVGERDWSRLAYQFGHELGHVLCNSWQNIARPQLPSQWLEETLVEAFSINGLGLLAESWEQAPPFSGDNAFGREIANYRARVIENYRNRAGPNDLRGWFGGARDQLEKTGGLSPIEGPEVLDVLAEYERNPASIEDLGALNRWPERTSLPLEKYLEKWRESCRQIGAGGSLPAHIAELVSRK
jgi:hypothetical protein